MSNLFDFKVREIKHGQLEAAVQALKLMPDEVMKRIERGGLRKSLKPIYDDVLRRVPVGETGNLKKGIKLRVKRYGQIMRGEVVSLAQHSHLVELGHRIVRNKKAFGTVEEHPFFRPAFHGKEEQVLKIVADEIERAVLKFEKKQGAIT